MERNLRELTLDRMLEIGNVQFYKRDVDYDKMMKWYEDKSIDIELDVDLKREQELSDMIYNLTLDILRVSGNEIKPISYILYSNFGGVGIHFNDDTHIYVENDDDDTHIYVENDIVIKGIYKFFRRYGYTKKDIIIKDYKNSYYWEVGLGTDFDFIDKRIHCSQFLLESAIQVIKNNLMSEY